MKLRAGLCHDPVRQVLLELMAGVAVESGNDLVRRCTARDSAIFQALAGVDATKRACQELHASI